jgi:hypothetical protein
MYIPPQPTSKKNTGPSLNPGAALGALGGGLSNLNWGSVGQYVNPSSPSFLNPDVPPPPKQGVSFAGGSHNPLADTHLVTLADGSTHVYSAAGNDLGVYNPATGGLGGPMAAGGGSPPVPPPIDWSKVLGGAGGASGAMTQYEQALIALDKQKLADAEAQQKADQAYRETQAVEAFNKQWQDYQVKNYYGSFGGPTSAAPAGSPWFYRLPEPTDIKSAYAHNPQMGQDPWNSPIGVSGYSGSGFLNPQQPGTQSVQALGNVAAPIAGQQPANPFPGPTSGQAPQQAGLDPQMLDMISSHPAANHFVMSLPGAKEFVAAQGVQIPGITDSASPAPIANNAGPQPNLLTAPTPQAGATPAPIGG